MFELIETWGSDQFITAVAASTRNKSQMKNPEKGLVYLWKKGHRSPFEFAGATIKVEAPIFTVRQWERHRTLSYNELSLRTVKLDGYADKSFWFPEEDTHHDLYEEGYQGSANVYRKLLEAGEPLERARAVLPLGLMSTLYISGNLRNWMQFLALRTHPAAQEDIRSYAHNLQLELEKEFPGAVRAWRDYRKGAAA